MPVTVYFKDCKALRVLVSKEALKLGSLPPNIPQLEFPFSLSFVTSTTYLFEFNSSGLLNIAATSEIP